MIFRPRFYFCAISSLPYLWRYLTYTHLCLKCYLSQEKKKKIIKLSINWPNTLFTLPMPRAATHVANPISQSIRNVSPLRYLRNINQYRDNIFNTLLTGYILNMDECKAKQRFCFKMPMMTCASTAQEWFRGGEKCLINKRCSKWGDVKAKTTSRTGIILI